MISVDPNTPLSLTDLSFMKQMTDLTYETDAELSNKLY